MRNAIVVRVAPLVIRAWIRTLRFRYLKAEFRRGHVPRSPGGIFIFWHQRILGFIGHFHHAGFSGIVSQHGDGEMLAGSLERLGIQPVRGSTTRGGSRAIREILQHPDREEIRIAITPDGPRGPRFVLREGALYLGSRTGLPVYPTVISYARATALSTWDGFLVPRPFTRALLNVGEKIEVPPGLDREGIETYRQMTEESLRALTEETDRDFESLYRGAKRLRDLVEEPPRHERP